MRARAVLLAIVVALTLAVAVQPAQLATAAEDGNPEVTLSRAEAGTGGSITATGTGWRPKTLLMLLICGQAAPGRDPVGGTNACANADGRAVRTDAEGRFSKKLPVAEPPVACPCVVRVTNVTGEKAVAQAEFKVAGHPVKPLPDERSGGKLAVLAATRLEGSSSILTWFGAPASRTLVATVGNLGSAPVKNPVFEVGTSHGVFAPEWEEQQWRGTLAPGKKAKVELRVQLPAGAHGDYRVALRYGGKVLAEQPWDVGRPWGVTLFWVLLAVVVPAAVFRIGMAVVDRVRPRRGGGRRARDHSVPRHGSGPPARRPVRLPKSLTPLAGSASRRRGDPGTGTGTGSTQDPSPAATTTTLPWFTPDSAPGAPAQLSAPHEDEETAQSPGQSSGKGNT
ncbi:hypothetical protein [Streptomyces sp. NPDC002851]